MKFITVAALVIVLGISVNCRNTRPLDIRITDDVVMFKGKPIDFPLDEKTLVSILGPPSRSVHKQNRILIWDPFGVIAYQKPGNTNITQITIFLKDAGFDFSPNVSYSGQFIFNACTLSRTTSVNQLNACSLHHPFTQEPGIPMWSVLLPRHSFSVTSSSESEITLDDFSIEQP